MQQVWKWKIESILITVPHTRLSHDQVYSCCCDVIIISCRIAELAIDKDGGAVCFGQLLGMCDHVSLTLGELLLVCSNLKFKSGVFSISTSVSLRLTTSAKEGYAIYKSVPYGTVEDTVPYLVRRAQENRTVLQGIRKERDLLKQEFYRRLRRSS